MERTTKSTKLQVKTTATGSATGVTRTFNNLVQNPSDDQLTAFCTVIRQLTNGDVLSATLTTNTSLTNA